MSLSISSLFNHNVLFESPGILTIWLVPAGVTQIGFELWGAGGGGGPQGGGQGGGYLQGIVKVSPSQTLNVMAGAGGVGGAQPVGTPATNVPTAGGDSSITISTMPGASPATTYSGYARGGAANGANNAGGYALLKSNLVGAPVIATAQWGLNGQVASLIENIEMLYGTGFFNTTYKCGNGGEGANTKNTHGYGVLNIVQTITTTAIYSSKSLQGYAATAGNSPGGGGGGGLAFANGLGPQQLINVGNGGNGKVILYYNL